MADVEWIDLVDPDEAELQRKFGHTLHPLAIERLLQPAQHEDEPRPTIERHEDYVFGVILVAVAVPEEDRLFYQEIDIVVTHGMLLTVRKTPPGEKPYDTSDVHATCDADGEPAKPGMVLYHLIDDIAERYLDLIDSINDEIDELEDHVEDWTAARVRERISGLRHDLLHVRRTLSPPRAMPCGASSTDGSGSKARSSSRRTSSCTSPTPTTSSCARATGSSSRATSSPVCATTARPRSRTTRTR